VARKINRCVYKTINKINGKVYIGFASYFKERMSRHLKCAETGTNTKFYNAIRKYGKDSFDWIILYDNLETLEICKNIEKEMIKEHNSYTLGYNSTLGGDGGFTGFNSGNFKKGNKPWSTGTKMSDEQKEFMRRINTGLKQSEKTIAKRVNKINKPVEQLDLDGNFIREFCSVKEAALFTGISKAGISSVCRKAKYFVTAGGYKWNYKIK